MGGSSFGGIQSETLTFDWIELQRSYLHVKWSEFHQESNGHGPRPLSRVRHVSRVTFFLTFDWIELQRTYLHVKWSEFYQESNGHGLRPLSHVRHTSHDTCHVFAKF